jgi:hypothetical protein
MLFAILTNIMNKDLLEKVLSGLSDKNIRFDELKKLVTDLSFDCRIKGDHHIFSKTGVAEIINLQPLKGGKAKPYQVKQVRQLILKHKLHKEQKNV